MKLHIASFFSFLKKNLLPKKEDFDLVQNSRVSKSKIFLIISIFLTSIFFLHILMYISASFSEEVPDYGGTIREGVIGAPKYINPFLASTETDQLITSLVYGGLMKKNDNGSLSPYIATSCEESPDGKSYQCVLPENAMFSDKSPLTADDVVFTFETKQKIMLQKDPISDWSSISALSLDIRTVVIKTTGSIESLEDKMTLGIVPKYLWSSVPIENFEDSTLNMRPVGIGPFVVEKVKIVNTIPTEIFMERNNKWLREKPFIDELVIVSYANQLDLKSGLKNGDINSTSSLRGVYVDDSIKNKFSIENIYTNKNVGIFINAKELGGKTEKALKGVNQFIDKKNIVDIIENGYGILPISLEESSTDTKEQNIDITIAVLKDTDLIKTAELISTNLKDFGIISTINVFDQGLFNDQLSQGGYSLVLGINIDKNKGYKELIPLYKKSIIQISSKEIHARTPQVVESPHESLREITSWYKNTDFVWKWFTNKK